MKKSRPQLRYSEEFKRMVVEEIETGVMNVAQACRYYGISVPVSIYKWLDLYGMRKQKGQKVLVMSYKEENELVRLRRELSLMKKELEEAELRAIAWKSMVDAIELDLGIPVKKKPWSQALQEARQQLYPEAGGSVLSESASSTDSASRPDTKDRHPLKRK
jgi:transposase-like protein